MTAHLRLRTFFSALLVLASLLVAPSAFAQMKFAVVDVQRAMTETEDGLRAQATLKKLFDKRQQELDAKQGELQRAREDIEKQAKVLSKEALQRRTEDWQRAMLELQNTYVEFNKELQKKQSELTEPIVKKIISILRQIASQDGYDAIFEKNAVPYARTDLDITDKVIQTYNAGAPKAPADKPAPPPAKQPAAPVAPPPAVKPGAPGPR